MAASPASPPPKDDSFARQLRGFGPIGVLAMVVIVAAQLLAPLSAVLALVWAARSRTPWSEIGYGRPRHWVGSALIGIGLGVVFKLVMKALVMPLLGADPINQGYRHLTGNWGAVAAFIPVLVVQAAWGEETFFRGYLFERLGKAIGRGRIATFFTVLVTAGFFGALHYLGQGPSGAQQATIVGLIAGAWYAHTRRIWMLSWAHLAFDLTALALVAWGLEARVAGFIFH